jgi:hypothetical protein
VVAAIAATGLATSCGAGGASAVSQSLESGPRPSSELTPEPAPGTPPGTEDLPGLDDLPEDLEDLVPDLSVPEFDTEGLERCLDVASALTEINVLAFTGDPDGRLPGLFEQLEADLPDELQDELGVVRSTVEEATGASIFEVTDLLLSSEFTDATGAIYEWVGTSCQEAAPGQLD